MFAIEFILSIFYVLLFCYMLYDIIYWSIFNYYDRQIKKGIKRIRIKEDYFKIVIPDCKVNSFFKNRIKKYYEEVEEHLKENKSLSFDFEILIETSK